MCSNNQAESSLEKEIGMIIRNMPLYIVVSQLLKPNIGLLTSVT
jgi:hypothetical protein